ncbi:hypothetical protein ACFW35_01460 [Fictibacillus sp. NPDC058756]|uniref:hypothetical protein n=1 Tax=Fictibacillus sp. NPDC058756 TaxID=3346625 RepID=UPI00368B0327
MHEVDGSDGIQFKHRPAFDAMAADLGISSTDDLTRRAEDVLDFLPRLWETAELIISANQHIYIKRH